MFALAVPGEAYAERWDVSPSTKRRSYRIPWMAADVGKVCKWCIPRFAPFAAVSLWVLLSKGKPRRGRPLVPSTPSPRTTSCAAGDWCYRGELGEQQQEGGSCPGWGLSRAVKLTR